MHNIHNKASIIKRKVKSFYSIDILKQIAYALRPSQFLNTATIGRTNKGISKPVYPFMYMHTHECTCEYTHTHTHTHKHTHTHTHMYVCMYV